MEIVLKPMSDHEDMIGYSAGIAHLMFKGKLRDTGLPYTDDHLNGAALLIRGLMFENEFTPSAVSAMWLHDGPEDIKELDVFNPFSERPALKAGAAYFLNDLLKSAGKTGEYTCFIVNLLTHRTDRASYQDYTDQIFTLPEEPLLRTLKTITILAKMVDRRKNLNPNEKKNVNDIVRQYISLFDSGAGHAELKKFLSKTKTIDAFESKKDFDLDVGLFVETIRRNFEGKQRGVAIDNLTHYLPLAEDLLLMEHSSDNKIFKWEKARSMLKGMYEDSLDISGLSVYEAKRMGHNRGRIIKPGYPPILKEIRTDRVRDLAKGKLVMAR